MQPLKLPSKLPLSSIPTCHTLAFINSSSQVSALFTTYLLKLTNDFLAAESVFLSFLFLLYPKTAIY